MDYPITGNVSLGNVSGNIKLYVNDSGSGNLTGFGYNNNCMTFSVNQSVTANPEMVIDQFGNVGIGTQTPAYTLDVSGIFRSSDIRIDNTIIHLGQNSGLTSQDGNTVAIGFNAGSITQRIGGVAIGDYAGQTNQRGNSVAIGTNSGNLNQSGNSVAIGFGAGTNTQGLNATALGYLTGEINQGDNATALGHNAGNSGQGTQTVAVGHNAGQTSQEANAVAIGRNAGQTTQRANATAVGNNAGNSNQGQYAVAIGSSAGVTNQGQNSIAIGLNSLGTGTSSVAIGYNATTSTYNNSVALGTGATSTANNQIILGTASENVLVPGTTTTTGLVTANGGLNINNNPLIIQKSGSNGVIRMLNNGTDNFIQSGLDFTTTSAPLIFSAVTSGTPWLTINSSGLTMGGSNNITLGSGATAPTAGQLGFIYSTSTFTNFIIHTSGIADILSIASVPLGTYIMSYQIGLNNAQTTGGYAQTVPFVNGATVGGYIFCSYPTAMYTTTSYTLIIRVTTAGKVAVQGSGTIAYTINNAFLQLTRIA